jgi:hypothetical protein
MVTMGITMVGHQKKLDEITLMELLNLNSEEIVDAFQDKIEDDFDRLSKEINNELEDYNTYE